MKGRVTDYLFVGAVAVAGFAYLQYAYRPAWRGLEAQRRELYGTEADIARSESFTHGLEDLQRFLEEFEEALAELDRLVPARVDRNDQVREISRLIATAGLHEHSIRPLDPAPRGPVTAHTVACQVSGGYGDLLRFLALAEALPCHTRLTNLKLERTIEDPRQLRARLELTFYSVYDPGLPS